MLSQYNRVLPRDLFNEADLLKCIGKFWMLVDALSPDIDIKFVNEFVSKFDIMQDDTDGSITVFNLPIMIAGEVYLFRRPLNSREPLPLYICKQRDWYGPCYRTMASEKALHDDIYTLLKSKKNGGK